MNNDDTSLLNEANTEIRKLLSQHQTVMLATVSAEGSPEASYAPCVRDSVNQFYVYVSNLAAHTRNIRETHKASILCIEDESAASHLFARKRLTLKASCSVVERNTPHWESIMDNFERNFGKLIRQLKTMQDFELFQLMPYSGSLVTGFGKAFQVEPRQLTAIAHRNEQGHQTK